MRRADHGDTALVRDPGQQRPDRERVRLVEPGRRLVGEEERGAGGDRARDGGPLPLARRESRDALSASLGKTHGGERLDGPLRGACPGEATEPSESSTFSRTPRKRMSPGCWRTNAT